MSDNIIKYGSRTFGDIRSDLISYIRQAYPEILQDFNDSSVGSMLIDLNAGVANNLNYNIDRVFTETQLENAQLRSSLFDIAKNLGFNIPNKRPSVTIVDFTVQVPVLGDKPDSSYYPVLQAGAQIIGGGKTFETEEIIDWNSPYSSLGDPNRSIIPNFDTNGVIRSYTVTKREVVVNGGSSIFKRVISVNDTIPFFSITLPDSDVLGIDSIILLEGVNYSSNPTISEFNTNSNRFYEVDYLAQQRIFIEKQSNDTSGLKSGIWLDVSKKFIKEFTPNGYCKITFGSGDSETDVFRNGFLKAGVTNKNFLYNFLNNTALGEKLKTNHTLFIKYRVGGGSNSNVGAGSLNKMGSYNIRVSGSRQDFNQEVQKSLTVNNPIPAIGGNDGLTIEQIRYLIKYNFSSQYRCVTLEDYKQQIYKMPGKFGSPFKVNTYKEDNKVIVAMLGLNTSGGLSNTSNSLLKENIAEYLSEYRCINDYVEVRDGKIINLAFDIDVFVENTSNPKIANDIITSVKNFLSINNYEMGEDIFLGDIINEVLKVSSVLNVISIKAYNKVGGGYSLNTTSQDVINNITGEIKLINNTIYNTPNSMFEILNPIVDIRVFLRKKV